jgi:hypothetical protein
MSVTLTDEQARNMAASLRNAANLLDPPATTPSTPTPPPPPASTIPALDARFTQVAFTDFPGVSLPPDFYAYSHSDGNEGHGYRDPSAVKVKDGRLVITAKGDVSGAVGQSVKQQFGLWEIRASFPKGAGTLPCILLWPAQERDAAGNRTWPSWIEYDLVETGSERNGGACNVHFGQTNTQTGPHRFDGDLTQWHVYACELSPQGVAFYLDGKIVKQLTQANVITQHPHRLGIQLDVNADGRAGPDMQMLVDWVRVSKFK